MCAGRKPDMITKFFHERLKPLIISGALELPEQSGSKGGGAGGREVRARCTAHTHV